MSDSVSLASGSVLCSPSGQLIRCCIHPYVYIQQVFTIRAVYPVLCPPFRFYLKCVYYPGFIYIYMCVYMYCLIYISIERTNSCRKQAIYILVAQMYLKIRDDVTNLSQSQVYLSSLTFIFFTFLASNFSRSPFILFYQSFFFSA